MVHQKQLTWRRNKTQEMMIRGFHQVQIAQTLKMSESTVSRDIDYLREQARQNMQTHLQDRLPEEYENCMAGINQVLKMSWEIATKGQGLLSDSSNSNSNSDPDRTLSSTIDDRTRLQALALANDCYKNKMDLVTNGAVITDAIKFVQQKKEELSKVTSDIASNREIEPEKDKDIDIDKENIDGSDKSPTNKIF